MYVGLADSGDRMGMKKWKKKMVIVRMEVMKGRRRFICCRHYGYCYSY